MSDDLLEDIGRQRLMNPLTLERLAAKGSNMGVPHKIINVFYVYDRSNIDALNRDLGRAGFVLEDRGTPFSDEGVSYWSGSSVGVRTTARVNQYDDRQLCQDRFPKRVGI